LPDRSFSAISSPFERLPCEQIARINFKNEALSAKNHSVEATLILNQEILRKIFKRVVGQKKEI